MLEWVNRNYLCMQDSLEHFPPSRLCHRAAQQNGSAKGPCWVATVRIICHLFSHCCYDSRKCPSCRQRRLIHLRCPSDNSMIHLLVSVFVFLPKCGSGVWPVCMPAWLTPLAPLCLAGDGTGTVLGVNADMNKPLWKRMDWTSSPSPCCPQGSV